jgi:hypothetical protein
MNSYVIDKGVENLIKDDFMVLLDEVKPDVILSIHPNFNGSCKIVDKALYFRENCDCRLID